MGRNKINQAQFIKIQLLTRPEILADIELLKTESTLQKVADKYNLSRERIRQIFKIIVGEPYTEYWRKKRSVSPARHLEKDIGISA